MTELSNKLALHSSDGTVEYASVYSSPQDLIPQMPYLTVKTNNSLGYVQLNKIGEQYGTRGRVYIRNHNTTYQICSTAYVPLDLWWHHPQDFNIPWQADFDWDTIDNEEMYIRFNLKSARTINIYYTGQFWKDDGGNPYGFRLIIDDSIAAPCLAFEGSIYEQTFQVYLNAGNHIIKWQTMKGKWGHWHCHSMVIHAWDA